jgi:hypothetical protein
MITHEPSRANCARGLHWFVSTFSSDLEVCEVCGETGGELDDDDDDDEPTPEELAYYAELDAQQERAQSRTLNAAPYPWGYELSPGHYFCTTCWLNGFEDGAHSHELPPCDPPPRVPSWA